MIKANELRVGNIICDYNGTIREVSGHDIIDQWWFDSDPRDGSLCAPLNPIGLTPEWLERMGFENGEIRFSYHTHLHVRPYQTATQGVFPGEWEITFISSVPYRHGQTFQYVHQLQNLYFALTGEELTIKEKV